MAQDTEQEQAKLILRFESPHRVVAVCRICRKELGVFRDRRHAMFGICSQEIKNHIESCAIKKPEPVGSGS